MAARPGRPRSPAPYQALTLSLPAELLGRIELYRARLAKEAPWVGPISRSCAARGLLERALAAASTDDHGSSGSAA